MQDPETSLNITIFGVGAMGCLFASHLCQIGNPKTNNLANLSFKTNVTLFGTWAEQIKAIQQKGLIVTRLDGSQSHHTLRVTDTLTDIPSSDIAMVLVKSHRTARATKQIRKVLYPAGIAITLQNGLGNVELLIDKLGRKRVVTGITFQGAMLDSPGNLRHTGNGTTYMAASPGVGKKVHQVSSIFNEACIDTKIVQNADDLLWTKLAINAAINPLTALLEVQNGRLLEKEAYRQIMLKAASEVVKLANAQNIQLKYEQILKQVEDVCRMTAQNRSSMLQDILRKAATEIDFISGAVVRIGKKLEIPTPVNEFLFQQIKAKQTGQPFNIKQLNKLN